MFFNTFLISLNDIQWSYIFEDVDEDEDEDEDEGRRIYTKQWDPVLNELRKRENLV